MADYTGRDISISAAPEDGGPYRRLSKPIIVAVVGAGLLAASLGTLAISVGCSRKPKSAPETTYNTAVRTSVCRAFDDTHYEVIGNRVLLHGFDDRKNPCIYEMSKEKFCSMYELCVGKPTPSRRRPAASKSQTRPTQPTKTTTIPTKTPKPLEAPPAIQPVPQPTPLEILRYPVEVREQPTEKRTMTLTRKQLKNYQLERCPIQ